MATKKTAAPKEGGRYIYLGPNHPRGLLVCATIFRGGIPGAVAEILEKCPSAKALLVETRRTAAVMQALGKKDSAYAALYKQADQELHRKGV